MNPTKQAKIKTQDQPFFNFRNLFLLDECSSDNVSKVTKLYSECESLVLTKLENMNVIQLTFIQEHIQRNTLCSSSLGKLRAVELIAISSEV